MVHKRMNEITKKHLRAILEMNTSNVTGSRQNFR